MVPGINAPPADTRTLGALTLEVVTLAPDGTKVAVRVET
jgi:hypothetical protein